MSSKPLNPDRCNTVESLREQFSEDPRRESHEKETAFHLPGDETHVSVTSFKKVVYSKLLDHPDFELDYLNIRDGDGRERTVDSLEAAAADPSLTIIGVTGRVPAGTMSVGAARNSNSHADLVK